MCPPSFHICIIEEYRQLVRRGERRRYEGVVVDEIADSAVWDAAKPDSGHEAALKHARRCWLSTGTKIATAEEH